MRNPYQSRKNKYGVAPKEARTYNNIVFDSKAEMERYKELILLEKAKKIFNLELQPEFILQESFSHQGKTYQAIKYKADFRYLEKYIDCVGVVVEDVKGRRTKEYMIKKKMLLKKYPDIDFREVS